MKNIIVSLVVFTLTLTACGSDDGSPPAIASLTYSPMTVPRAQQSTVTGSITFTDKDGDAAQLGIDVTLPDATSQELPLTDLQNVGEMTSGTIAFSVILTPPLAGAYQFELFIVDDSDNESNRLMGTLTAQ